MKTFDKSLQKRRMSIFNEEIRLYIGKYVTRRYIRKTYKIFGLAIFIRASIKTSSSKLQHEID